MRQTAERVDNRVTVRLPEKLLDLLIDEADRRGLDPRKRGIIIIEALEDRYNPEKIKNQIRQALREDPSLVAEAVQAYAVSQLVKK